MTTQHAAVVLAGGAARRMGGSPKPELVLGGRRLLDRVLDAVGEAAPRIVVGPPRRLPAGVRHVQEEPPGGGPVAGLAAALPLVTTAWLILVAADLPFLTADVVQTLLRSADGRDGALLVDEAGRDQLLVGAWSVTALRAAVASSPTVEGASLYGLLRRLDAGRVAWEVPPGTPPPWWDCDRPEDLDRARQWLGDPTDGGAA